MNENQLTEEIIGAAIEIHRAVGPGLLESVYENLLAHELGLRRIPFERQKLIHLVYKGLEVVADLRMDLLVGRQVVVELKSVEQLLPLHEAQLLTYLRLSRCKVGLLINFNAALLKYGIRRMVNDYQDDSASSRLCGEGERGDP